MKLEKERDVLATAMPLLAQLYGEIRIDDAQKDKPDAAFFYLPEPGESEHQGARKVGVEITSADRRDDLQYFNDEKMAREATARRLEEILAGNPKAPVGPLKSKSIPIANDYIYEGIKDKAKRHQTYMDAGDFEQIVLLFTSEFLSLDSPDFAYLARWTDHLLGKGLFPFSKAIFVCRRTNRAQLVFDKGRPARGKPARKRDRERGETRITSQIFPMGQSQLGGTFNAEPLLTPKKRKSK